jgi:hypothetical protein
MNALKFLVILNLLISSNLYSQKLGISLYAGANRTSISNYLIKERNPLDAKSEFGFLFGVKADYKLTSKLRFVSGLGLSNRTFSEPSFSPGQSRFFERMYFLEIPMMISLPLSKNFYTTFGLVNSYKFEGDTHYFWDNQDEILYGIDAQVIGGYKINRRFGLEAGVLYGSLLDHALGRLNFTNFVGSLCFTYKLK